jgi:hypothetical protein
VRSLQTSNVDEDRLPLRPRAVAARSCNRIVPGLVVVISLPEPATTRPARRDGWACRATSDRSVTFSYRIDARR